ncbi:hypothetical protein EJ02DRAFT_497088 [Clathrospora elynae]|uniref:Uncharacterized protein n=1 Tax=Clathrospora elynae TaxID=706981 RepID=A0A6A5SIE0_9PLEO|nr:hypothetical protein EJ02DRAFT_497088 [Clathrospora elynae]
MACMLFNCCVLLVVHLRAKLVFGKAASRVLASREKALGGASLDTHIVIAHANADEINVLCGYSSHLNSLTNMHIRINSFRFVLRESRCLVISLVVQGAALVSSVGNGTKQGLGSIIWLALYLILNGSASVLDKALTGNNVFAHQPGTASNLPSMVFSGRKAALAFVAHLPVIGKADKWAWTDIFMPNKERWRTWEAEMNNCRPYLDAKSATEEERLLRSISSHNRITLIEVKKAYNSPKFAKRLATYMTDVGLGSVSQP